MTTPIDYSLGIQYNPNALEQGFATGDALLTLQRNRQIAEQGALAKQQAQQQAAIRQQQLAELMNQHVQSPSFETASKLAMLLPKDQAEQVNKVYSSWDTKKQQNISGRIVGLEMAMRSNPKLGAQLIRQYGDSIKEAGDPDGLFQTIDMAAKLAEVDPQSAIATLSGLNIAALGADKYGSLIKNMGEESRSAELQPYKVGEAKAATELKQQESKFFSKKLMAEINAANAAANATLMNARTNQRRLDFDIQRSAEEAAQKIIDARQRGVPLSDGAAKILNESVISSGKAAAQATRARELANRFNTSTGGSAAGEAFAKWFDNEDERTLLLKEYESLTTQEKLASLPPGPATDKDMEQASKAILSGNAPPKVVAKFLTQMADRQDRIARAEQIKADWLSANGNLGRARADIQIGDVIVPAGRTLNDAINQSLKAPSATPAKPAAPTAPTSDANYFANYKG